MPCNLVHMRSNMDVPRTLPINANRQMANMASQGWQLVSTSAIASTRVVFYLFWEKD